MTKCFCDVCGAEMPEGYHLHPAVVPVADLCGLEDLCPRCDGLVIKMDAAALVLTELRRLASKAEVDAPDTDIAPSPALTGRGVREKRDIMAALEVYRKEQGPGCIPQLAR